MSLSFAVLKNILLGAVFSLVLCTIACSSESASDQASKNAGSAQAEKSASAKSAPSDGKIKFRPYEVIDDKQNNLVISRLAVPQDWKTTSRVEWNYRDFYAPVHVWARMEAPDSSAWIDFFPAEFFLWLDPQHDRSVQGPGVGGIHHANITLQEAMVRYVVARNRSNARNLKIIGSRSVNDLPKSFPHVFDKVQPQGEGICMRVQYQLNGAPVDEEFYGFMGPTDVIPATQSQFPMIEYHRRLFLVHSMGAKNGKLESVRPLLGFVATSIEPNPGWQQRYGQIVKAQQDFFQRNLQASYAGIAAAGERSRQLTAQSDAFLRNIDSTLQAQRTPPHSSYTESSNEDFYKSADAFDQNIRGTEHMQDQYGQVTDQPNNYNYHWTDGFGTFVHTDDPNLDPNHYLNGNFQQMTAPQ